MKDVLELLQKFLPIELAVITALFVYMLVFFKRLSDKFVDLSDKQVHLAKEQTGYIRDRLDVVEKTLGINDRAIDLRRKQVEELAEIAEERDRQYHDAQQRQAEVEAELQEISGELQAAQARYAQAVEEARLAEQGKEELRQAGQRLEASVQAGAARVFAHELRGPVQHIIANAGVLRIEMEREQLSPMAREALAQLQALASRVSDRISNTAFLAQHSDAAGIEIETIRLTGVLCRVLDTFRELSRERGVHVVVDEEALRRATPVRANPQALQIALSNVMDNAVKYAFRDTEIRVHVQETEETVDILISNLGIGIGPDEVNRVFDLGYRGPLTADRFRTGMGLGLSVASRLVDGMSGEIDISSRLGGRGDQHIVTVRIRLKKG
jgi:signal transduction histidine kinase